VRLETLQLVSFDLLTDRKCLLGRKMFGRLVGTAGDRPKKLFLSGRRHCPKDHDCAAGVLKGVPGPFRDKNRPSLLDRVSFVIEYEGSTALQNVDELIHVGMPVARYADAWRHLLSSQGNVLRTPAWIHFDKEVSTAIDQVLPLGRTKDVTPRFLALGVGAVRHHSPPMVIDASANTISLQQVSVRLGRLLVNFDMIHRTTLERVFKEIEHWVATSDSRGAMLLRR